MRTWMRSVNSTSGSATGSWPGSGGEGTNVIESVFDGRVIVEHFDGRPGIVLRGMSVSTYDVEEDLWRQTWVDSEGRYLDFAGGMRGRHMDLRRQGLYEGEPALFRMLWHEISEDSLRWTWECSTDAGRSWKALWAIAYERLALTSDRPKEKARDERAFDRGAET
jgi:hypothetical protein